MGGWADVILLALAASCPYSEHDIAATSGSGNTLMTINSPRDAPSITKLPRMQDFSLKLATIALSFVYEMAWTFRRATKETTTVFHVSLSLPPPIPSSKLLWPMKRAVEPAYHAQFSFPTRRMSGQPERSNRGQVPTRACPCKGGQLGIDTSMSRRSVENMVRESRDCRLRHYTFRIMVM